MSDLAATPPGDDDASFVASEDIQCDRAEYAAPAPAGPTCGFCNRSIADIYYETGGKVVCANCREKIEESFRGGFRFGRVLKALVFGTAAAVAGGALYYLIVRLTGINLSLVAVVVGFMVGRAVRVGSGNRGGLLYQLLAVFLTYTSIVGMQVPMLAEGFIEQRAQKDEPAKAVPAKADADRAKAEALVEGAKPQQESKTSAAPPTPKAPEPKEKMAIGKDNSAPAGGDARGHAGPRPSLAGFLTLTVILIGFLYALPIQIAIHAPMLGLIYGFALWEAWKMTKGFQISFNGPFRVSTS